MDSTKRIAASKHKLHSTGIVILDMKIATQINLVPFVVLRNLGADALLGCSYTDNFVEAIWFIKSLIVLENGKVVPIQCKRALVPIEEEFMEDKRVGTRHSNSIKEILTAERVRIPANSEMPIAVKAYHFGTRLVEPFTEFLYRKKLSIERTRESIPIG